MNKNPNKKTIKKKKTDDFNSQENLKSSRNTKSADLERQVFEE